MAYLSRRYMESALLNYPKGLQRFNLGCRDSVYRSNGRGREEEETVSIRLHEKETLYRWLNTFIWEEPPYKPWDQMLRRQSPPSLRC